MEIITTLILGIVCILLGISNARGNISSLHYYHRKRVAPEDRLPFGKLVGLGTIIIGAALMLMGAMYFLAEKLQQSVFGVIGTVGLMVGMAVGLAITFYAMIKYNKGIF